MTESKLHLLTKESLEEIDTWIARYPEDRKQSAVIAALSIVQVQNEGYVTVDLMDAIAEYLEMEPISVYEVASFYARFVTEPCGRHHVAVCTNIACALMGSDEIVAHCEKKLGIKTGESTPDGRIFLKQEEECLAACGGGPMMQVNDDYYEYLTPERVDEILDKLE
ncbi:MAG TPA: NAD(P)H-dependent oxidoreductase subunit E [Guyparkeria sp.]|nr:NAD(P)H-dependent oxidoreductase subunit E [Guyparkeria sp.]